MIKALMRKTTTAATSFHKISEVVKIFKSRWTANYSDVKVWPSCHETNLLCHYSYSSVIVVEFGGFHVVSCQRVCACSMRECECVCANDHTSSLRRSKGVRACYAQVRVRVFEQCRSILPHILVASLTLWDFFCGKFLLLLFKADQEVSSAIETNLNRKKTFLCFELSPILSFSFFWSISISLFFPQLTCTTGKGQRCPLQVVEWLEKRSPWTCI